MNINKIKMDVKESLSKSHDVNIDNVFCQNLMYHSYVSILFFTEVLIS